MKLKLNFKKKLRNNKESLLIISMMKALIKYEEKYFIVFTINYSLHPSSNFPSVFS